MGTIESWKKSPWKKIDADGMDQECKRFTKDLRQLDKEMRAWYDFIYLFHIFTLFLDHFICITYLIIELYGNTEF